MTKNYYVVQLGLVFENEASAKQGEWCVELFFVEACDETKAYAVATRQAQFRDWAPRGAVRHLIHIFPVYICDLEHWEFVFGKEIKREHDPSFIAPLDRQAKDESLSIAEKLIRKQISELQAPPRCKNALCRNIRELFFLSDFALMPFDIWCERVLSGELDEMLLRDVRNFGTRSLEELKSALKTRQE